MRVAYIPLDSRPPNWLFPQRLAEIAGIELRLPPRGLLGSLHRPADSYALLRWLIDTAPACDAAVFSADALLYGGLVQSRASGQSCDTDLLLASLAQIDWRRCAGYCFSTVPRLGMTIDSADALNRHELIREFLIARALADSQPGAEAEARVEALIEQLGADTVTQVLALRRRSQDNTLRLLRDGGLLGLRWLHVAVEDNAPQGPHLAEAAELRQQWLAHKRNSGYQLGFTVFDGADECGCLLLAKAALDFQQSPPLPVRLSVHPSVPGPERYTGLYESHSLAEGLDFCARLLSFDYAAAQHTVQWMVCHGVQPQPDAFSSSPSKLFNNPFLLPAASDLAADDAPLHVADLAACNGGNPYLVQRVSEIAAARLCGYSAWNTNFNALGLSAALLSLTSRAPQASAPALRRFLLERLADDLVYQSLARPEIVAACQRDGISPFDFGDLPESRLQGLRLIVRRHWRQWYEGPGRALLAALHIPPQAAALVQFDFPWQRAFEIEAVAPEL